MDRDPERRTGRTLTAMLQTLEWSAEVDVGGAAWETEAGCPHCDQAKRLGHLEDCGLADAIATGRRVFGERVAG